MITLYESWLEGYKKDVIEKYKFKYSQYYDNYYRGAFAFLEYLEQNKKTFNDLSMEFVKQYYDEHKSMTSVYILDNFFDYLYSKGFINKLFYVDNVKHKYPVVYISDYIYVYAETKNSLGRRIKYISFDRLENNKFYSLIRQYAIYLLQKDKFVFTTIRSNISNICRFINHCESDIEDITSDDALSWIHFELTGKSQSTVNSFIYGVNTFFNYLFSEGIIKKRIELVTKTRKYRNKIIDYSYEELEIIYSHFNELPSEVVIFIKIATQTGMRNSEILDLKKDCLNIDKGKRCFISSYSDKAEKSITNPITYKLYCEIKKYINDNNTKSDYLISSCFGRANSAYIAQKMKTINKEGIIKNRNGDTIILNTHRFRHTLATLLYKNGTSVFVIQKLLHHASVDNTYLYLGIDFDNIKNKFMNFIKDDTEEVSFNNEVYMLDQNFKTKILLYGSCVRHKKMGECKSNPNSCYSCKHFIPDIRLYSQYKKQKESIEHLVSLYKKNLLPIPDDLLDLSTLLNELLIRLGGESYERGYINNRKLPGIGLSEANNSN